MRKPQRASAGRLVGKGSVGHIVGGSGHVGEQGHRSPNHNREHFGYGGHEEPPYSMRLCESPATGSPVAAQRKRPEDRTSRR